MRHYAIKSPDGNLLPDSVASTEENAWFYYACVHFNTGLLETHILLDYIDDIKKEGYVSVEVDVLELESTRQYPAGMVKE